MASVARLAYQIREANQANQTIIVMILLLLKYSSLYQLLSQRLTVDTPDSIAEQFIGIIVSCMPLLPTFVRHISKHTQTTYAGSNVKKNVISTALGYRGGSSKASKAQAKDPYPINVTTGYEELDDPETGMQTTGLGGILREVEMTVIVEHTPH